MVDDTAEADGDDEHEQIEQSGSGLRTLVLVGVSFAAGYFVGKSQGSEPSLREELDDLERTDEGPMEIEIQGTEPEPEEDETEAENSDEDSDE